MGSLHAAHHAWNVKLAGLRRSGDRTRPQLAGCRETEGFDSSWLALLFVKRCSSFLRYAIFVLPIIHQPSPSPSPSQTRSENPSKESMVWFRIGVA